MIVPGTQNFMGYIGSTFDTIITVYPQADSQYTWVGSWLLGVNYSIGNVVIGTDNSAYGALKASTSVNPIGDVSGSWSTPLVPMNLNGYSGFIWVGPIAADELTSGPVLATPLSIQGLSGTLSIKFAPSQSTTPLINPGNYHHYIELTDGLGNSYYYLNGTFQWLSP